MLSALSERPPAGVGSVGRPGRKWLAEQQLPIYERETVDSGLRQVDFLGAEITDVEKLIAGETLWWPQIKQSSGPNGDPSSSARSEKWGIRTPGVWLALLTAGTAIREARRRLDSFDRPASRHGPVTRRTFWAR